HQATISAGPHSVEGSQERFTPTTRITGQDIDLICIVGAKQIPAAPADVVCLHDKAVTDLALYADAPLVCAREARIGIEDGNRVSGESRRLTQSAGRGCWRQSRNAEAHSSLFSQRRGKTSIVDPE